MVVGFFVKLDLTIVSYLASGSERSARDEARTPQAPRHEHPNLVAGSGLSRSKDDVT